MNVLFIPFRVLKLPVRSVNSYLSNCNRGAFGIPKNHVKLFFSDNKKSKPKNSTDYESMRLEYKPQVPEYFNFASDVLDKWSDMEKNGSRGSNPALWWLNQRGQEMKWSFQDLALYSKKVANILSDACNLQLTDRVIVVLPLIPEWWLLNVACMRTGTVLIPGTSQLTTKDILYRLQASNAKCIVTNDVLADSVEAVMSQCPSLKAKMIISHKYRKGWINFHDLYRNASSDHKCARTKSFDPLIIFFTSGTTGAPKMVLHTHYSFGVGLTVAARYWLDLTTSDVMWNTSDPGWAKSMWNNVFTPWIQGSCVFASNMHQFNPEQVLQILSRYPITTFCSTPTVYRRLVQSDVSKYKFKNLQHCVSAGEPINPEAMTVWKEQTGLDIYEGYAQTETVLICATFKWMKIKPGSMGKPTPSFNVQIIDENCNVVPPGMEGDIAIDVKSAKPFGFISRYIDQPEQTAASLRGDYYLTGDRGRMDEDGYVWFMGRADDIILSSGYRIGPFEVENALIEHPAVAESAVVSSPDPVRREVVKAFVILTANFTSHDPDKLIKELQEHVKKTTAPYKYPRKIEFVKELPKTISGKIRRIELRKKEWESVKS
ncbi:acyl-coenzyme A synthetase ACSM3, mitochondrial [Hypanus sabinus]|uniref:acyl-coenzyme A synthetase ACSM3, mitochondrial n=1 Tax=Hypanus sabinus TaxID=79690 RepID=UPI0028C40DA8|nr:acyl-coenzyme A synthetase ACSM3, mitochondrial [Hypanus sabinus]XP_059835088.1 acyl-coenzyme A synthetase ACSM3, mitochondrial [Hypanus sabinus]